jgi:hypothetical protein
VDCSGEEGWGVWTEREREHSSINSIYTASGTVTCTRGHSQTSPSAPSIAVMVVPRVAETKTDRRYWTELSQLQKRALDGNRTYLQLRQLTAHFLFTTYIYHVSPTCFDVSHTIFSENIRVVYSNIQLLSVVQWLRHKMWNINTQQRYISHILWRSHCTTDNSCMFE